MSEIITAETLVEEETILCNNAGDRCEECPDINYNPPSQSECEYFDMRSGTPICTRADGTQRVLDNWISSPPGHFGSLVCPDLVTVLETEAPLPQDPTTI